MAERERLEEIKKWLRREKIVSDLFENYFSSSPVKEKNNWYVKGEYKFTDLKNGLLNGEDKQDFYYLMELLNQLEIDHTTDYYEHHDYEAFDVTVQIKTTLEDRDKLEEMFINSYISNYSR